MQTAIQIETPADKTIMKTQALIRDLEWRLTLLASDIREEEERTGVHNLALPEYSLLARNLRSRRDNLLATVTILKSQLERHELEAVT